MTPTGSITIGNGTALMGYKIRNNFVRVDFQLIGGSTTVWGSSEWAQNLPFAQASSGWPSALNLMAGSAKALDTGTAHYSGVACISANAVHIFQSASAAAGWTPTFPFTWTTNDVVTYSIEYPI